MQNARRQEENFTDSAEHRAWFLETKKNPQARLRLFCFPYAGGGASMFRTWSEQISPAIEVIPVQFPGHESRLQERPFTRISTLVDALGPIIYPHLTMPFALFGHSMGALVAFELARTLRKRYNRHPAHLLVSARNAPQIPYTDPPIHGLSDVELIEHLQRRYQGIPPAILAEPDLMELFIPTLRADFSAVETYRYREEAALTCPISVFGGMWDERVSESNLRAWAIQTTMTFTLRMFPGDHFFFRTVGAQMVQAISQDLTQTLQKLS
jgi:medium-chain acyl-[acyl-carrier-protein] hydrolase